jgi:hypothetical protein
MHHTDLGKLLEVFEDFVILLDDSCSIAITPIVPPPNEHMTAYGIKLIFRWADSQLIAEINNHDRDSNETRLHFYSSSTAKKPDLSVTYCAGDFDGDSIRLFLRTGIKLSKGQIDLSLLDFEKYFYQTSLRLIEPNELSDTVTKIL